MYSFGITLLPLDWYGTTEVIFKIIPNLIARHQYKKDIEQTIRTWDSLKKWCKETGDPPNKFFNKDQYQPSEIILKDVFFKWFEFYKKTVKETTWSNKKIRDFNFFNLNF